MSKISKYVGDFVPSSLRFEAYADRPFKNGCIHISAAHIYATVLQNLNLQRGILYLLSTFYYHNFTTIVFVSTRTCLS